MPQWSGQEIKVETDAMMIERLLNNLLSNVIKYPENKESFIGRIGRVRKVAVEIIDNGPVIEESHLPYLFDAFYRAKNEIEGSGLGLAIAKRIVQLHKGRISARTTTDKSTVFVFTIPRKQCRGKHQQPKLE